MKIMTPYGTSITVNCPESTEAYYVVVYRVGGTSVWSWRETLPVRGFNEAMVMARNTARMGYNCIVQDFESLMSIGAPVSYDANMRAQDCKLVTKGAYKGYYAKLDF